MRKKKLTLLIVISSLSLVALVTMQINWIRKAAELQEQQYNHRVNMALWWVKDRLEAQQKSKGAYLTCNLKIQEEKEKIVKSTVDSLLKRSFAYYNIDLQYTFINTPVRQPSHVGPIYCPLSDALKQLGLDLRIKRAEQKSMLANVGYMHVASLIVIVLLTGCFLIIILTMLRQKKLADMTADFINNMTHEFKTPIASISLASNMLKKDKILFDPSRAKNYARIIHEENSRLQEQVDQVLQMAQFEKGELKLNKAEINVHESIQQAINTVELQVASKNGRINCDFRAGEEIAMADKLHLTNIICNLLDNANKYSPHAPQIRISTRNENNGIVIAVEDKGIGINKENQKQIFNRFYRVPTGNLHNIKGFGLGLAYVKMIVDAHKGHVSLKSEPGRGSCFELYIPVNAK